MSIYRGTELQLQRTVADVCEIRQEIIAEITRAMEHFSKADALLHEVSKYGFSIDRNTFNYNIHKTSGKCQSTQNLIKQVDKKVWQYLITMGCFESLMSGDDRKKLFEQLENPEPATLSNVTATLKGLMVERPKMLHRLVDESFRDRCKSYKSNRGLKINKRQVIVNAFATFNDDRLKNIIRAIGIITGSTKEQRDNQSRIYFRLDSGEKEVIEFDGRVKFKSFFNGNCHVWILDEQLLGMLNDVLAYGKPNRL